MRRSEFMRTLPGKLPLGSWQTACAAATVLVVAGCVALVVHDSYAEAARSARFWQEVAGGFEDPACADFARAPVKDLPRPGALRDHRCHDMVATRRHFERDPQSPPLTAAEVRTWQDWRPIGWSTLARDGALVAGVAMVLFLVLGLGAQAVARRLPVVASPLRWLAMRFPDGRARRLAPWLLQVGILFALGFAPLLVLYVLA